MTGLRKPPNQTLNKTRFSYLLRELLLKRGISNLLEFTGLVSEKGLKLVDSSSLTPANLQSALKNMDKGFFKSNHISRKSFYKIATSIIKKEVKRQKQERLTKAGQAKGISIFGSQFHFGPGDNVGRDKILNKERKESFIEKFFWHGVVALIFTVLAGIILTWLNP